MIIPQRNLEVRIQAESGFSGGKIKIIRDLSIKLQVKRLAPPSLDTCDLEIKNMLKEDVNILTTMNYNPSRILKNTLEIWGGESGVFSRIFKGDIIRGSSTYGGDSKFTAQCQTNYFAGIKQIGHVSIKGREDVTNILTSLCRESGLNFINKGVSGIFVKDPILQGSAIDQIIELCDLADIDLIFSDNDCKIFPKVFRGSGNAVLINANNGMLKFPTVDELGINVTVKFNRNILVGDVIRVDSENRMASGDWKVFENTLNLSNQEPQWEMTIRARK